MLGFGSSPAPVPLHFRSGQQQQPGHDPGVCIVLEDKAKSCEGPGYGEDALVWSQCVSSVET